MLVDPRIGIDMLTDYMKKMYRVIVAPQKVYKAKRRILKSIAGGDHFDNFNSIWDYVNIIKQEMSGTLALLKW